MKYKVGDKVKVIDKLKKSRVSYRGTFVPDMDIYLGKTIEIEEVDDEDKDYYSNGWHWTDEMIERKENEKYNMFTKDDLENGDIIFLRNGNELIVYNDNELCDLESDYFNPLNNLEDLEEDLTYEDDEDYDVVEVKRPSGYDTMFERKEEVKEMTVSEISKKLGYEVKIVKEKK